MSRQDSNEFVMALYEAGPKAIESAIFQRDSIIAKILRKYCGGETRLHSTHDSPAFDEPFGLRIDIDDDDAKIIIIKVVGLGERLN